MSEHKCLYNCVRVLNNGIDILLLRYDQERFLCIKGLMAEICARESQCQRCVCVFVCVCGFYQAAAFDLKYCLTK